MPTLKISISEDILHTLNENESGLANIMKVYTAMQLFHEGKLTLGQASEMAGMSRLEFMRTCGMHGIPVMNYDASEIQEELKSLQ